MQEKVSERSTKLSYKLLLSRCSAKATARIMSQVPQPGTSLISLVAWNSCFLKDYILGLFFTRMWSSHCKNRQPASLKANICTHKLQLSLKNQCGAISSSCLSKIRFVIIPRRHWCGHVGCWEHAGTSDSGAWLGQCMPSSWPEAGLALCGWKLHVSGRCRWLASICRKGGVCKKGSFFLNSSVESCDNKLRLQVMMHKWDLWCLVSKALVASLQVQTRFLPSTKSVLFTERVLRPPDSAKLGWNSSKSLKLSKVHIHRYSMVPPCSFP